jgi:hypothetical protein
MNQENEEQNTESITVAFPSSPLISARFNEESDSICGCNDELGRPCESCDAIKKTVNENWCFKWLRQLQDYEACLESEKAESDRQVHLMVDHTDDKVINLRHKLAFLQTQTVSSDSSIEGKTFTFMIYVCISFQPAWTIIEKIKNQAELHAVNFSNILQKERLAERNQQNSAAVIGAMAVHGKKELVGFVEAHINKLLRTLYHKIHAEEKIDSPSSFKDVERQWFITLYAPQRAAQAVSQKELNVVGPLGERPLHVAALAKYRFGAIDFEGRGNYFAEGVGNGIKKYISDPPNKEAAWKDVTMPYGKDYCAAVGDFIKRRKISTETKSKDWGEHWEVMAPDSSARVKIEAPNPPFWDDLSGWYCRHLQQRKFFAISKTYSNMLVTRGLYEGETILFPFIAENDDRMVRWLLDKEDKLLEGSRDTQKDALPLTVAQGAQPAEKAPR